MTIAPAFSTHLYPAFAPLPVPMANHLLLQEERKYRWLPPLQRPALHELTQTVLGRIRRARAVVYEYMFPFVEADRKRHERGEARAFPNVEWLLEAVAQYSPQSARNAETTVDFWQTKGLLRRKKARGLLEVNSVAALLVTRLAEEIHLRNWLPSTIEEGEPHWWCYGQERPGACVRVLPVPLPGDLPASCILWTPWQGAAWDQTPWHPHRDANLYRWARPPELEDLLVWDTELPAEVVRQQAHPLFGRPAVQHILLEEARSVILTNVMLKGAIRHDGPTGVLFCESGTH